VEPVYRTVVGLAVATFRARGWDVRITGEEHVPRNGGAIIASNHISYLDFVFDGYAVLKATDQRRLVRFAAKKEVFDHRVSGPLMRAMKHLPVDRAGSASQIIELAVERLRAGELVGMFPEATVGRSFVPLPAKTGTVRMAQLADVPIVPVALWGSHRLYPKDHPRDFRRGVVITVDFGPPMAAPAGEDRTALTTQMMSRIGAMVAAAQERYPQRPAPDEDPWWVPAHLGGTAPTVEEAEAQARADTEARLAQRRAARLAARSSPDGPDVAGD